jgi:hypothetical protein
MAHRHTTLRPLVDEALQAWESLTGVQMDATQWRMGEWDVRDMHNTLQETLALDPEGTTTAMVLDCFLRAHLEAKTFTAAAIMKDFQATMAYLQQAEQLFALVQSDIVADATAAFRGKLLLSAERYGARTPAFEALTNNPDALPFLRRDALCAVEKLKPFQFLAGPMDSAPPQILPIVHQAWDITALLEAVRDMPVSGIALVLVRDPAHPERSFFGFAIRNGGNVAFLTDKGRPAYPGQEDVLAARGSRGTGCTYAERAWRNRFPYQIIPTSQDEKGDVVFEAETTPVLAGRDLVPLMHIRDLPADQAIWLTMMASLVAEKFWAKGWQAEKLSYTGAMVTDRARLVRAPGGALVAAATGYTPIQVDTLTHDDVSAEGMEKVMPGLSKGLHRWMEDRYAHKVPAGVFNIWAEDARKGTIAIAARPDTRGFRPHTPQLPATADGLVVVPHDLDNWKRPATYPVTTFSKGSFGTEAEIQADRVWIGRRNLASYVQKLADEEHQDSEAEIKAWVKAHMEANLSTLLSWIGPGVWPAHTDGRARNPYQLEIHPITSGAWRFGTYPNLVLVTDSIDKRCAVTDAKATWRARFTPHTAEDLALLCGVAIEGLPEVLHHWAKERAYAGNHLLDRLDPMDAQVDDPWRKTDLSANIYLSKRAYTKLGGTQTI